MWYRQCLLSLLYRGCKRADWILWYVYHAGVNTIYTMLQLISLPYCVPQELQCRPPSSYKYVVLIASLPLPIAPHLAQINKKTLYCVCAATYTCMATPYSTWGPSSIRRKSQSGQIYEKGEYIDTCTPIFTPHPNANITYDTFITYMYTNKHLCMMHMS